MNNEIVYYPDHFINKEERDALDEIRTFIRDNKYPVSSLAIEKDSFFIAAIVPEVTENLREAAYKFNDGSHLLLFDFISENSNIEGEIIHV